MKAVGTSTLSATCTLSQRTLPPLPPDVGKCLSSLGQTGYRYLDTTIQQTYPVASSPAAASSHYTLEPRTTRTTIILSFLDPAFHIRARRFGRPIVLADPPTHHHLVRRPLAERALLPSRAPAHAALGFAPRLCPLPPSRSTAVLRVEHRARLAPRGDARGRPRRGPERLCRESCVCSPPSASRLP